MPRQHPDADREQESAHTEQVDVNPVLVRSHPEQVDAHAGDVPARRLEQMLGASTGEPFADLASTGEVVGRRQRLRQLRAAVEDRHLGPTPFRPTPDLARIAALALRSDVDEPSSRRGPAGYRWVTAR